MSAQCTKCDECTKTCPLILVTNQKNIWGIFFNQDVDIWNCSSCFRCEESCPVDLSVRDALFKKRRAIKKSELPPRFTRYFKNIVNSGNVFPIDEFVNERRRFLGLELIDFKKLKDEMKKLLAETE